MSDRQRNRNGEQEEAQQIPSSARGRPGPVHEALYGQIMEDVLALVQEYAPTTGTVTGMDGGKVLVSVDDEPEGREIGLPREKGRRYDVGDRVRLQRSRGSGKGQYTVLGQVSTKAGKDPAVGGEDLHDKAVTKDHIGGNAVQRQHIDGGAVGSNEVEKESLGLDRLTNNAQNTINNKADGNHKHDNDYAAKNHDHNYAANNHTHNYASNNHSHNEYASSGHGHKIADITGLEKRLSDIEAKLKKGESNG